MKITRIRTTVVVAAAVVAMGASAAVAAVTFNPNTGTGFVGKGDVAQPWGWNNSTLNELADDIRFSYEERAEYSVECTWETNRKIHSVNKKTKINVDAGVEYEARKNKQQNVTGFTLGGFADEVESASAPVVGQDCPNGNDGTVTAVGIVSSSGGMLVANYGSLDGIVLWTTPPAE